jgi:hypothetical protein
MRKQLSDQVKMHLQWIGEAAKSKQLAALMVTEKATGEEVPALVIMVNDESSGSYEMYPVGIIAEDMSDFMERYAPPGDNDEAGTTGESSGDSHGSTPNAEA